MHRWARLRGRVRIVAALVAVGALALLTAPGAPPASASGGTAPPDFELVASSPHMGFLVRGGLQSCTVQAGFCFGGLTEPKYVSGEITGDSSWVVNSINVLAINGFTGTVALEVVGLPAGVTSQTATSVTLDGSPSCCFAGRSGADTPFALKASAAAAPGRTTLALRATSGATVHTLSLPIDVVDRLPAQVLEGLFFPSNAAGGTTVAASVNDANYVAPASDATVALQSSDPAVASVPATVTVPGPAAGGSASAPFTITTHAVSAPTPVAITASLGGEVITGTITVNPPAPVPADTVAIGRAEYTTAKRELRVEASGTSATATLRAFVTQTNELIGTLTNNGGGKYSGQFTWPVNAQNITVRSSAGGSATAAVVAK